MGQPAAWTLAGSGGCPEHKETIMVAECGVTDVAPIRCRNGRCLCTCKSLTKTRGIEQKVLHLAGGAQVGTMCHSYNVISFSEVSDETTPCIDEI